MHRGYTKRWRKRWDKGYHKDGLLWVLMDYFIDFSTYKDKEVFKKGVGKIKLKRGQWHFTYRELAKFMAVNPRRIRTCISMLTKLQFLTLQPTHQYTIATVNKYDTYQPLELLTDTPIDTDPTQGRHRVDTPLYNTKKVNKDKNIYTSDFLAFWEVYPKRVGKGAAFRSWKAIKNRPSIQFITDKVFEQQKSDQWQKDNGQYIPNPATWLNQRRWEDEGLSTKSKPFKTSIQEEEEKWMSMRK